MAGRTEPVGIGDAVPRGPDRGLPIWGAGHQQSLPRDRTEGSQGMHNGLDLGGPQGQQRVWDPLSLQLCDTPQPLAPPSAGPFWLAGWAAVLPLAFSLLSSRVSEDSVQGHVWSHWSNPPGTNVSLTF